MSSLKPYAHEPAASISKRFLAFLIDAFLLVIVHFTLLLSTNLIVSNTAFYKEKHNSLEIAMNECYQIEEEAKILEFIGDDETKYSNPVSLSKVFERWCSEHILESFNKDNSTFLNNGVAELNLSDDILASSYENDGIAYFYVNFVKSNNSEYKILPNIDCSCEEYYYRVMKNKCYTYNDDSLFVYDDVNLTHPYLNGKYAYELYNYLFIDSSSKMGLSIYNLLAKSYQDIWNLESEQLLNCEKYLESYDVYLDNYNSLAKILNISLVSCYTLSFVISIVLPVVLLKDHQTLGKHIGKLRVVDMDGYETTTGQICERLIVKFISFFGFTAVSSFLVSGGGSSWTATLFTMGRLNVSILTINIFILIIDLLSLVVSAFVSKKRCFADLIAKTYLIDMHYYLPSAQNIFVEECEEKSDDKEIVEVIDSSTIKK